MQLPSAGQILMGHPEASQKLYKHRFSPRQSHWVIKPRPGLLRNKPDAQNRQNRARADGRASETRGGDGEVLALGSNESGCAYNDGRKSMPSLEKGKSCGGHSCCWLGGTTGRVEMSLFTPQPRLNARQTPWQYADTVMKFNTDVRGRSGGCGDDEMADDEDGGEDEEDEEDGDS
ncbi:hypothetical protein Tco_0400942 [Tanacetum coccineum]